MRIKFSFIAGALALLLWCPLAASKCVAQDEEKSPQEQLEEGIAASQNQEFDKAAEIFRKLIESDPDNTAFQFHLGYNLHASGKVDEALPFHLKASEGNSPFKPTALYNAACVHSIKKENDKAFDYLKKAVEAGFIGSRSLETIKSDADMDNIRTDDRFAEMVALIENDGKAPAPAKLKAEDLFGEWKIISGMKSGGTIESGRLPTIKITKKSFTIPNEAGEFVMSYKLDMDAEPITVDFKIESGPVPEGKARGILKLEDGTMTLCYHPEGETRPDKFLSTAENGFFMFKMKRPMEKTEAKSEKSEMAKAVIGKWKCVKGTRAGQDIEPVRMASIITFEDNLITIPVGEDEAFKMSYTIDASKSPIAIDMKIEEGPAPNGEALGIIKMENGRFFLCYDPTGQKRPEQFESTESDGRFLFEMEKAKE